MSIACSKTYVNLNERSAAVDDPEIYQEVFLAWSRTVKVIPIDGLENILTARVTYLSHAFRQAYIARVAADVDMTASEKNALRAEEMSRAQKGHEFYVTLMTGVKDCDELDPEEGPWRIRLIDDNGREIAPSNIEEIEDPTARDIKYFDFDPDQRKAYRLVFPKNAADGTPILSSTTRYFEISFSAAYGKKSARWETTVLAE
jgi:hypothetical protein